MHNAPTIDSKLVWLRARLATDRCMYVLCTVLLLYSEGVE